MSNKLFELKKHMSRQEISEHLHKIAEGVEKGSIDLNSGDNSINLKPSENPEFEIEVERSGNETSLEIEIEWKDDDGKESLEIS